MRKSRFKKGSPEAKRYMASIRRLRGKERKMTQKERKEHRWMSRKQIRRVVKEHLHKVRHPIRAMRHFRKRFRVKKIKIKQKLPLADLAATGFSLSVLANTFLGKIAPTKTLTITGVPDGTQAHPYDYQRQGFLGAGYYSDLPAPYATNTIMYLSAALNMSTTTGTNTGQNNTGTAGSQSVYNNNSPIVGISQTIYNGVTYTYQGVFWYSAAGAILPLNPVSWNNTGSGAINQNTGSSTGIASETTSGTITKANVGTFTNAQVAAAGYIYSSFSPSDPKMPASAAARYIGIDSQGMYVYSKS